MGKRIMIQGFIGKATEATVKKFFQFREDGTAYLTSLFDNKERTINEIIELPPINGEPYDYVVSFWDKSKVIKPKEAAAAVRTALEGITEWGDSDAYQSKMTPIWDKYNLWATLVLIRRVPKRLRKRKSKEEIIRVGSTFAGAVANSKTIIDDEKKTVGANLSLDAKRVLLFLAKLAPKKGANDATTLFGNMPGAKFKFERNYLKKMAISIFGHGGTKEIWRVVKSLEEAAATVQTIVKIKDSRKVTTSEGESQVTRYEKVVGSFITFQSDCTDIIKGDTSVKLLPEKVSVSLTQIFNYWIRRWYLEVDVPYLLERSRDKNGEEYFAIRLWLIDLAPVIKEATRKGNKYEATFRFEKLSGWSEANRDVRQKTKARCEAVADEICQDMEADYWEIVQERGNGGLRNVGIKFVWLPSKKEVSDLTDNKKSDL